MVKLIYDYGDAIKINIEDEKLLNNKLKVPFSELAMHMQVAGIFKNK